MAEVKIVSDPKGHTENYTANGKDVTIAGTIQSRDLYTFYVQRDTLGTANSSIEVKMVLPVGGDLSGLYRFPRVGEKVLVDSIPTGAGDARSEYYLLGYIPSAAWTPFAPVEGDPKMTKPDEETKLKAQQGMVLRYKNSNKDVMKKKDYSEIGFYNAETDWKKKKDDSDYPSIDRINIQSTGDLHIDAQNHHRTKAKRFEILVGLEKDISHRTGVSFGENDPVCSEGRALGDRPGDDSRLSEGDAQIRANNRVIIKAKKEIRLQVGRTVLIIDDTGFRVTTSRVNSNWTSSWDTSLNLHPLTGVTMVGQKVNITGIQQASMGDNFGGGINTQIGVVKATGREVSFNTLNNVEYGIAQGMNDVESAFNTAYLSCAKAGVHPNSHDGQAIAKLVQQSLKKIGQLAKKFYAHWKSNKKLEADKEAAEAARLNAEAVAAREYANILRDEADPEAADTVASAEAAADKAEEAARAATK